jgi:hypothetical protein
MSRNKTSNKKKGAGRSRRRGGRRYLVQAELELPPPAHGTTRAGDPVDDDSQAGSAPVPLQTVGSRLSP